jgi:hypothetical protein
VLRAQPFVAADHLRRPLNSNVRLHMAPTQKNMHISVVVLFSIASAFYLSGAMTSAIVFSVIGLIIEVAAWVAWFATASSTNDAK